MIVENNQRSEKYKNPCIHLHTPETDSFLSKGTDLISFRLYISKKLRYYT